MKMPDPQYVVKNKAEKIFDLGMGVKRKSPHVLLYRVGWGD